jgi:hypothetical protein
MRANLRAPHRGKSEALMRVPYSAAGGNDRIANIERRGAQRIPRPRKHLRGITLILSNSTKMGEL